MFTQEIVKRRKINGAQAIRKKNIITMRNVVFWSEEKVYFSPLRKPPTMAPLLKQT